jgi:hypothetical protein
MRNYCFPRIASPLLLHFLTVEKPQNQIGVEIKKQSYTCLTRCLNAIISPSILNFF